MMKINFCLLLLCLLTTSCSGKSTPIEAQNALEDEARTALLSLYESAPSSKILGDKAKAILVFPAITKGGFILGGQYGEGVILKDNFADGFYRSVAGSFGLQAGLQKFGYAMFFMDENDLSYLDKSDGWEVGVGPTITIVDAGLASSLSTTTLREGVYTFFFGQKGLMAGVSIEGTKITKFTPGL